MTRCCCAQKTLAREGRNISIADIQAVLWYYEKRLYGEMGARASADVSYEEAAKRVVAERQSPDAGPARPAALSDGKGAGGDVSEGAGGSDDQDDTAAARRARRDPGRDPYLEQDDRGQYRPDTNTISLLKKADPSTFIHEAGHHFLNILGKLAAKDDAPFGIKQDMDKLLSWFGVKEKPGQSALDVWHGMTLDEQRPFHEQFARGFERYMAEGKAPSPRLKGLFEKFKDWLKGVYKSLDDLGVKLTPEVRGVMDRMLNPETPRPAEGHTRLYRGTKGPEDESAAPFYSDDPDIARMYAGETGHVAARDVKPENMLTAENWMKAKEKLGVPGATMPELIDAARAAGHDWLSFKTTNGNEFIDLSKRKQAAEPVLPKLADEHAEQTPVDPIQAALDKNPNMVIPDENGNMVNAAQHLQAAKEALAQERADAEKSVKAAINCYMSKGMSNA